MRVAEFAGVRDVVHIGRRRGRVSEQHGVLGIELPTHPDDAIQGQICTGSAALPPTPHCRVLNGTGVANLVNMVLVVLLRD